MGINKILSRNVSVKRSIQAAYVLFLILKLGSTSSIGEVLTRTGCFSSKGDLIACESRYSDGRMTVDLINTETLKSELVLTNAVIASTAFLPDSNELSVVRTDGVYSVDSNRHALVLKQAALWSPEEKILNVSPSRKKIFGKKHSSWLKKAEIPFFVIDMPSQHRYEFSISNVNPKNVLTSVVFADDDSFLVLSDGYHVFKVAGNGTTIECLTKKYEGQEARIGKWNDGSMYVDVSRDGKRIAFSTKSALYTMNADGSGLMKVVDLEKSGWIFGLKLSPDNARILFVVLGRGYSSTETGLYSVEFNGEQKRLLDRDLPYSQLSVSMDGKKVAFEGGPRSSRVLYIMNTDGTGKIQIFP